MEIHHHSDGTRADLARGYTRVRGALARATLHSLAGSEALAWLARHLRAIAEEGEASSWFGSEHGHDALVDRIRYAADALRTCVPGDDDETRRWWADLEAALGPGTENDATTLVATVLRRALRSP